jgi:hypothetical protein
MSRETFTLKVAEHVVVIALVVGCGKADLDRTLTTLGPLMPTVAVATSTTSALMVMGDSFSIRL